MEWSGLNGSAAGCREWRCTSRQHPSTLHPSPPCNQACMPHLCSSEATTQPAGHSCFSRRMHWPSRTRSSSGAAGKGGETRAGGKLDREEDRGGWRATGRRRHEGVGYQLARLAHLAAYCQLSSLSSPCTGVPTHLACRQAGPAAAGTQPPAPGRWRAAHPLPPHPARDRQQGGTRGWAQLGACRHEGGENEGLNSSSRATAAAAAGPACQGEHGAANIKKQGAHTLAFHLSDSRTTW